MKRILKFIMGWQSHKKTVKKIKDDKPIESATKITDEEIPQLIQLGYDEALKYEKTSTNPKFHRTEKEEELSFNFSMRYSDVLSKLENNIYDNAENVGKAGIRWIKSATQDELIDKIKACDAVINSFEKCKKFCYGKGKGGTIYFQDMWEYCHNSKNQQFSYIDSFVELKEELQDYLQE